MNKDVFISYLADPSKMNASSTSGLKDLITQYPYFQTAQLLYLKNLYDEKSIDYSSQLKIAAVYANSRKKLYELVMQRDLRARINAVDDTLKTHPALTEVSLLEEQILKEAVSASIEMEVGSEPVTPDAGQVKKEPVKKTRTQKGGDRNKKHTFNQWLFNIQQGEPGASFSQSSDELVSNFIREAPSISSGIRGEKSATAALEERKREPFFSPIDTARLSIIDNEEFVTETLAKIYENQQHYDKAIKSYEFLSLKYPKNSNTFAARIEYLREKQKSSKEE